MKKIMFVYLLLTSVCELSASRATEMSSAAKAHRPHFRSELDTQWIDYIKTFNKSYSDNREMLRRRKIWEENVDMIQKHNEEATLGAHTYTMGVNQFTDMTFREFSDIFLSNYGIPDSPTEMAAEFDPNVDAPPSVDWRTRNAVTPVRNQGLCGSCWAFSATGAIEGQWAIKYKQLVPLSKQNLVDCSSAFGNHGCTNGTASRAFSYVISNGGIDTENCYPYEAQVGTCRFNKSCIGATVKSFVQVRPGENNLAVVVGTVGPTSVAIRVTARFEHYKKGIFSDPTCNSLPPNHAVLVVGYGPDYWIIKNSHGQEWGIGGYLLLAKNRGNMCQVASYPRYPIVP